MNDDFRKKARKMLIRDEGYKAKPYRDTVGKMTIGVGRNLDDVGVSGLTILQMLDEDIDKATEAAFRIFGEAEFCSIPEPQQLAILNMIFNLGEAGFSGFKNTIAAIKARDWQTVRSHALQSKWAKQVGKRAERIAELFLGNIPESYRT